MRRQLFKKFLFYICAFYIFIKKYSDLNYVNNSFLITEKVPIFIRNWTVLNNNMITKL